jgi:hypothetical protein
MNMRKNTDICEEFPQPREILRALESRDVGQERVF